MSIPELFKKGRVISLEVFPPKPDAPIEVIDRTLSGLSEVKPDYMSVTYGAGGSTVGLTVEVAQKIPEYCNCPALGHITCATSTAAEVDAVLSGFKAAGVSHVLALRGDVPEGMENKAFPDFKYASELVAHIRDIGGFSIAAACYPEGHFASPTLASDMERLRFKVDQGVDWLVSQLFFDNDAFFSFIDRARRAGISVPVTAGIMPVLDTKQIFRMTTLCGASVPASLSRLFARYGSSAEDFAKAGLDYCCEQILALLHAGVDGIHLYTMNKADVAKTILYRTGLRQI